MIQKLTKILCSIRWKTIKQKNLVRHFNNIYLIDFLMEVKIKIIEPKRTKITIRQFLKKQLLKYQQSEIKL